MKVRNVILIMAQFCQRPSLVLDEFDSSVYTNGLTEKFSGVEVCNVTNKNFLELRYVM